MTKEKHYFKLIKNKFYGICNLNKEISENNVTSDFFQITCDKCKSLLIKDSLKIEFEKGKQQAIKEVLDYLYQLENDDVDANNIVILLENYLKVKQRLGK